MRKVVKTAFEVCLRALPQWQFGSAVLALHWREYLPVAVQVSAVHNKNMALITHWPVRVSAVRNKNMALITH